MGAQQKQQAFRLQFPLVPAEAVTIHKSQGQTYQIVCVNLVSEKGRRVPMDRAKLYVALSRVTKLENLYIVGEFKEPKKPSTDDPVMNEIENLKTNKLLKLCYNTLNVDVGVVIGYHNVRSFFKHKTHIINDSWYHRCDVLVFSETQTMKSDIETQLNIPGFTLVARFDDFTERAKRGVLVFAKPKINIEFKKHSIETIQGKYHSTVVIFKRNDVHIITGYASPNTPAKELKNQFMSLMPADSFDLYSKKVFIGDFNYDAMQKNNPLSRMMNEMGCKSMMPADEMTTNNNTQIDAVFANFEKMVCGAYESYFSDHKPIFCWIDGVENVKLNARDMEVCDTIPQIDQFPTNFSPDYISDTYSEGEPEQADATQTILDDSQIPQAQISVANRKIGFFNTGLSCWANAFMQCLINLKPLRDLIEIRDGDIEIQYFKAIFDEYVNERATRDSITDALMNFRRHFDAEWAQREPRDVTEALYSIFRRYNIIGNVFTLNIVDHNKCTAGCHNNRHYRNEWMYKLYLPENNQCNNIQELLNENQSSEVEIEEFLCNVCGREIFQRRFIENPNSIVILYLQLGKKNPAPNPLDPETLMLKEMNFKVLENVAEQDIAINNEIFEFSGSIMYHGGPIMRSASNHYTAILKHNNILVKADDSSIVNPYNWPQNSKDLFVLFYVKK